jgi:CheY-like chemotaxis protein
LSRILIIDDELWSVRSLILQMVVQENCAVEIAIGPAEGLRFLRHVATPYDVVIVDLEMEKRNPRVPEDASGAEYTDGRVFCLQYRELLIQKAKLVGLAAEHGMAVALGGSPGIDFVLDKSMPPDVSAHLISELCESLKGDLSPADASGDPA